MAPISSIGAEVCSGCRMFRAMARLSLYNSANTGQGVRATESRLSGSQTHSTGNSPMRSSCDGSQDDLDVEEKAVGCAPL